MNIFILNSCSEKNYINFFFSNSIFYKKSVKNKKYEKRMKDVKIVIYEKFQ